MIWQLPLLLCLALSPLILSGCQSTEPNVAVSPNQNKIPNEDISIPDPSAQASEERWAFDWDTLEARIHELTNEAMRVRNSSGLYKLKSRLVSVHTGDQDKKAASRAYWTAVLNTNLIFAEQEHGESSQVVPLLDESIELLERADYVEAETNALLAMLYRTKIDHNPSKKFELYSKMLDALESAIEADPSNLRVLLAQVFIGVAPVAGFSLEIDVHTSIDSAFSNMEDTAGDAMSPTWGQAQLYALAIGRLMESEKINEASELITEAINKFPDDYVLRYWAELFEPVRENSEP